MEIKNEKRLRLDGLTKAEQDFIHQEIYSNLEWYFHPESEWRDIGNAKFERFDHVIYRTKQA